MLSREDERRLAEIEQRLQEADPKLAAFMRDPGGRGSVRWLLACLVMWLAVASVAVAGWWVIAGLVMGPLMVGTALAWVTWRSSSV